MLLLAGAVAISAAEKTKTAMGKVTAVSGDSLSIMSGSQTMTFAVDATTKVLGKGLGTMASEKKAKNEPFTITDGVGTDDTVKVTSRLGGGRYAAQVNVVEKSMKPPAARRLPTIARCGGRRSSNGRGRRSCAGLRRIQRPGIGWRRRQDAIMRTVTLTFLTLLLETTPLWASPQVTFVTAPASVQPMTSPRFR
jgi:hypothetical protein